MKENFDEIQDVLAAFQKGKKDCVDGSHGTIEEQDGVDVTVEWKQARNQITKEKLSRGLGGARDLKR